MREEKEGGLVSNKKRFNNNHRRFRGFFSNVSSRKENATWYSNQ